MPKSLCKIDENGHFGYFPGVTVVSSFDSKSQELVGALHEALVKIPGINEYFSLLPASSYHMTLINLYTEEEIGASWPAFISKNLSVHKELADTLKEHSLRPSIEKIKLSMGWTISLNLTLPIEQENQIREIANAANLGDKVPYVFHITLAYLRQDKDIPDEVAARLEKEVNENVAKILNSVNLPMNMGEGQLCYFKNMTAFYPWDGNYNPFYNKPSIAQNVLRIFFSAKKNTKVVQDLEPKNYNAPNS